MTLDSSSKSGSTSNRIGDELTIALYSRAMAGQSAKKQVVNNTKILKEIHLITWISNALFALSNLYFDRPQSSKPYILSSIPVFLSLLVLEKTGRPAFDDKGKITRQGQDLAQEGVTEYLFDVIYFTTFLNTVAVLFNSNKIFWLYLAIPLFAGYKIYNLINAGRQMFGGGSTNKNSSNSAASQPEEQKSKRQQKREARGDKAKVRYR